MSSLLLFLLSLPPSFATRRPVIPTLTTAHPCRFLPPSRCFADNFAWLARGHATPWTQVGYGAVLNDDGSPGNPSSFSVDRGSLLISDTTEGHLEPSQCASEGVSAHLEAADFFADGDIRAKFSLSITGSYEGEGEKPHGTAVGFAFRFVNPLNHYRFEWHQDGCMSLIKRSGTAAYAVHSTVLTSQRVGWKPYKLGDSYDIEVLAHGEVLRVSVDGKVMLDVTDSYYPPNQAMGAAFYASGRLRAEIDDFVLVDAVAEEQLASWKSFKKDPADGDDVVPCDALGKSQCYREAFDRDSLDPETFPTRLDGPPSAIAAAGLQKDDPLWTTKHDTPLAQEVSGFGYQNTNVRDACLGQYGSVLEVPAAELVASPSRLISFRMRLTDPFGGGIGVMFRYQPRVPGFRDSERYYRYSWGRAMGILSKDEEDEYAEDALDDGGSYVELGASCEGLYRFQDGEFEQLMAAEPERTPTFNHDKWYDIAIFLSEESIEISRNGVLIGRVYSEQGGLSLSYGSIALWCGGHSSTTFCEFDDLLVVDRAVAHHVWTPRDKASQLPVPPEAPLPPVLGFDAGRYEGTRTWTYATRDGHFEADCLATGLSKEQPVMMELHATGHITVIAPEEQFEDPVGHKYTIPAEDFQGIVTLYEPDTKHFVFRIPRSSWVGDADLLDPTADESTCMRWHTSGGALTVAWNRHQCRTDDGTCGFRGELEPMAGMYSKVLPPVLAVYKPKETEMWVVGSDQANLVVHGAMFRERPELEVKLVHEGLYSASWPHVSFKFKDDDLWATGNFKATVKDTHVHSAWHLGINDLVVEAKGMDVRSVVGYVEIQCPVCQGGKDRETGASCRALCKDERGCEEERCMGSLACHKKLAGWHEGTNLCMRYATDVRTVCTREGACALLNEYEYCYAPQVPVLNQTCKSSKCMRHHACERGSPAGAIKDINDLCYTHGERNDCKGTHRCSADGACVEVEVTEETSSTSTEDAMSTETTATEPPQAGGVTPMPVPSGGGASPPGNTGGATGGSGSTGGGGSVGPGPAQQVEAHDCKTCAISYGQPGSPLWCQCCAYNCGGYRGDCVTKNGFCTTRCNDPDDADRYCWWKDGDPQHAGADPPPPPPPLMPGYVPGDYSFPPGETPIGRPPTAPSTHAEAGHATVGHATARDEPAGEDSSSSTGLVFGVLVVLALTGGGVWYYRKHYHHPRKSPALID